MQGEQGADAFQMEPAGDQVDHQGPGDIEGVQVTRGLGHTDQGKRGMRHGRHYAVSTEFDPV